MRYRAAWCFNRLEIADSAYVYAHGAFTLEPGNDRCLGELLRSLASRPERVLEYSYMVGGGGVCRYRLARAELEMGNSGGESVLWLLNEFESGDSLSAADAGCWLSILFPHRGLQYIGRSVLLAPNESFYRCLLVEKLIDEQLLDSAAVEFDALTSLCVPDLGYWQTASSFHRAAGQDSLAILSAERAYELRRIPSTAADLGWLLYFRGRDLVRENRMSEAVPFLYRCSQVWSSDSSWALRADSLLDLMNEFTSINSGYGAPI